MDTSPPRGLWRLIARAPVLLYRAQLGRILGERFLMLIHTGRRTGKLRQTVLEVAGHDTKSDTYFVVSGWGEKADWFQNILKSPDVHIHVGRRRLPVRAERLTNEQAEEVLLEYARRHRLAARVVFPLILGKRPTDLAGIRNRIAELPVVALKRLCTKSCVGAA